MAVDAETGEVTHDFGVAAMEEQARQKQEARPPFVPEAYRDYLRLKAEKCGGGCARPADACPAAPPMLIDGHWPDPEAARGDVRPGLSAPGLPRTDRDDPAEFDRLKKQILESLRNQRVEVLPDSTPIAPARLPAHTPPLTDDDLVAMFATPESTLDQLVRGDRVRHAALALARAIVAATPPSADQTAAVRKVREAVHVAVDAIHRGGTR